VTLTIYHNPRCSKSRQTLQLLDGHGIAPRVVKYLDTPPSVDELSKIAASLGGPRGFIRTGEDAYKTLNLSDATDAQLLQAMHENPKLIERPIVVAADGQAALGRPPENVLKLLDN